MTRRHKPGRPAATDGAGPLDAPAGITPMLRALIEHASDAVIVQDPSTGRVAEVNRRAEELYGYSREEFLAFLPGWDLRTDDECIEGESLYALAARDGEVPARPRWHRRKDGSAVPVEAGVTRIETGGRTLLVATLRDVSARLETQAELERLYAESVNRGREVEVLLEATAALNVADTEEAVVRIVAERAAALCGAEMASIGVLHGGRMAWIQFHCRGVWQQLEYEPPATGNIIMRVVGTAQPYRCDDLALDPYSDHAFDAAMGLRTQLTVPAAGTDGRVLGGVSLYNKVDGSPFTDHDEALLMALASQAAVALERTQSRAELAQTVAALSQSEERFRSLVQNGSDLIVLLTADGIVRYVSPSVERLLGYRPEELLGTNGFSWIHPDDVAEVQRGFIRRLTEPDAPRLMGDFRVRHRDGSWRAMDMLSSNLVDNPSVRGIVVNMRDITERRKMEEQLKRQAYYDPLTELPNRALFMERLSGAIADRSRRRRALAVMFLDLDGFKVINDSLGHGAGDELLVCAARRIVACLQPDDTLARFGGDEFTILTESRSGPRAARRVAERIIAALRAPFYLKGREICITASIGITLSRSATDPASPDERVREADIALYQAKAMGRGRAVVFDQSMNTRAVARLELESDLRRALEHGELLLHYQPEVHLDTGTIVGMEALVRWQHPQRGLLSPLEFIPIAEETGLILPIGHWVLVEACRQARSWQEQFPSSAALVVSVNLSARQFQHPGIVEQVRAVLRDTGLAASSLRLEITETLLMEDTPSIEATLCALRDLGVWLAIDDFGTGYSSLSYLRRFAVDTVKIDRSFIIPLDRDEGTVAIVRAIITLSHALGMDVTAEGIETGDQLARLRAVGCDRAQGFLFACPLVPAAMAALLAAGQTAPFGADASVA
jgi:diguanylate cyclase (GGDEF)-like protein/PAS domain S-box-containing protein